MTAMTSSQELDFTEDLTNPSWSTDDFLKAFVGGEYDEYVRQQNGFNTSQNPSMFSQPQQNTWVNPPATPQGYPNSFNGPATPYSNVQTPTFANTPHSSFGNQNQFTPTAQPTSPVTNNDNVVVNFNQPIYVPRQSAERAVSILNDVQKLQLDQKSRIERIFQTQRQFMAAPQQQGFNELATAQKSLKDQIENELKTLNNLYDSVYLEPPDIQRLFWLRQDLEIQLKQLELLMIELNQLVTPNPSPHNLACLVILKQPFPVVISKNKQLPEDQIQVQLLTSANVHIQSISQVKAILMCDINHGKGGGGKPLEADIQSIDPNSRIAKFPLKFCSGTKKAPGNLKFGMQIVYGGSNQPITIERHVMHTPYLMYPSNVSQPFVVITNECQWEGSAGTLLKKETFSNGQLEVTWFRFANTLQHHFLKATRQELARPRRTLSNYDITYLHQKFFGGKHTINQKDFDDFWEWFGKGMQKLRYQRHICSLWQNGLIYGFMAREDVENALLNQEPGVFLMRFSERHHGQFAIAYTGTERPSKIKHYLVQPNDTSAKKTLPDFLQEQPQFATMLVLTSDVTGNPTFMKCPKAQALEPYCGKKITQQSGDGYDPL